jgi:hypothetical protein
MHVIARRMSSLKLDPGEKTYAAAIAIMVMAQPDYDQNCMQSAAGPAGLKLVQQLKEHVSFLAEPVSAHDRLMEFPMPPLQFKNLRPEHYSNAYHQEPPVQSKLCPLQLAKLKKIIPCRLSRTGCREAGQILTRDRKASTCCMH